MNLMRKIYIYIGTVVLSCRQHWIKPNKKTNKLQCVFAKHNNKTEYRKSKNKNYKEDI